VNPVVDAIKNLRHADLNRGTELLKILDQLIDAFGIGADNAEVHRRIYRHPLKHVGQRQKGDAEVAFIVMVHLGRVHHGEIKIGVGDHGPFRRPRRSGGVSDRRRIFRQNGAPDAFKTDRIGFMSDPAFGHQVVQRHDIGGKRTARRFKKNHGPGQARFLPNRQELLQERLVFDEANL